MPPSSAPSEGHFSSLFSLSSFLLWTLFSSTYLFFCILAYLSTTTSVILFYSTFNSSLWPRLFVVYLFTIKPFPYLVILDSDRAVKESVVSESVVLNGVVSDSVVSDSVASDIVVRTWPLSLRY